MDRTDKGRALDTLEITILMPGLNEAQRFLAESGASGEVLIADNGSSDGSQQIAEQEGARVIAVTTRGYGALTAIAMGIQLGLIRFLSAIIDIPTR